MKLPPQPRIRKEDIPNAPGWINKVLIPLNRFFENVYLVLNKRLTFTDNFTAEVKTITIRPDEIPYEFKTDVSNPKCVIVGKAVQDSGFHVDITSPVFVDWRLDKDLIVIENISNLTTGKIYNITLLITGE